MSNDDCAAICPKCRKTTFLALLTDNKGTIHTISIHCRECRWEENWKQEEGKGFVKQPEPPKTLRKIFVISYKGMCADFELDAKNMRKVLNEKSEGNFVMVEEIPNITEIKEIDLKYVNVDGGCGFTYKTEKSEDPEIQKGFSGFPDQERLQPPKPEIVKNYETCGWNYIICRNPKDCHACLDWKPIEEETYGVCIQCGWKIRPFKKNLWCLVYRGEIKEVKKKEPESHE